jgi:Tfp pilus assembly major pilin PilA
MQWYEILLTIPVILIGADIRGKIYEYKRNYFKTDNWRCRNK